MYIDKMNLFILIYFVRDIEWLLIHGMTSIRTIQSEKNNTRSKKAIYIKFYIFDEIHKKYNLIIYLYYFYNYKKNSNRI